MSDTKINVKVNKDNTVSISVEMGVKPPVWSREYRKFLPNEGFQRFHWTDAYRHLRKEGYIVDQQPSSGPVKLTNASEEHNSGTWVFKLKNTPKPKVKATTKRTAKKTTKKTTKKETKPKEA